MKNKAVIFDLDGTMLYTIRSIARHVNQALADFGLDEVPLEVVEKNTGNSSAYLIDQCIDYTGAVDCPADKRQAILDAYNATYLGDPIPGTTVYEGIPDLLKQLAGHGFKLGVCSNKPDDIVSRIIAHFFPGPVFGASLGFREDIPRKPDPKPIYTILEALDADKDRSYYVGDSEVDADMGIRAGIRTILVSYGYRRKEVLEKWEAAALLDRPDQVGTWILQHGGER